MKIWMQGSVFRVLLGALLVCQTGCQKQATPNCRRSSEINAHNTGVFKIKKSSSPPQSLRPSSIFGGFTRYRVRDS